MISTNKMLGAIAIILVAGLCILMLPGQLSLAQEPEELKIAEYGDPPRADLISISEPNEDGVVIIRGETGAAFPGSLLAIRNMYTGQTIYPRSELSGAFVAEIYGPGNTPFWVSHTARIENIEINRPGSLPGGPGTIIYGPFPTRYSPLEFPEPPASLMPPAPITLDGSAEDWVALADEQVIEPAALDGTVLLQTAATETGLYLAFTPVEAGALPQDSELRLELVLDGREFVVEIDANRRDGGRFFERIDGTATPREPLGAFSVQDDIIELQIPRLVFTGYSAPITIQSIDFTADDAQPSFIFLDVVEHAWGDSTAMPYPATAGRGVPFTLSGPVGGGTSVWQANAKISDLSYAAADIIRVDMQVIMPLPELPGGPQGLLDAGLRMGAELRLEPVTIEGAQTVADHATGNGWSGLLTPSGLPIENASGGVALGDATAQNIVTLLDEEDEPYALAFTLQWAIPVDEAIPDGLYTPVMTGWAALTGIVNSWDEAGILGDGPGVGTPAARWPIVLQIGDAAEENRLVWSLFANHPSASGARGVLPIEDGNSVGISGRTGYSTPYYILPRTAPNSDTPLIYPLEPYLPAMLGNSYTQTIAPLIPFDWESGTYRVAIIHPDGTIEDLGDFTIHQNMLSSEERDEAQRFGATSPVDIYRLSTYDPALTSYSFPADGLYSVTFNGEISDIWGNAYSGGGSIDVYVARPLQMMPGVLPGTPFEIGDTFNPALTITPGFPADVTTTLTFYPLDGSIAQVMELEGTANEHGYLFVEDGEPWTFEVPGEYIVDTVASYTDDFGNLWMGSARGAGVIASPDATLVSTGGRDIAYTRIDDRLAWYALDSIQPEYSLLNPESALRWPYHNGDIMWVRDEISKIWAGQRFIDTDGAYQQWLVEQLTDWTADNGLSGLQMAQFNELPLITLPLEDNSLGAALVAEDQRSTSYAYLSAGRPGVTTRQLVLGDETAGWAMPGWDFNSTYNNQMGVGLNGDLPGDYSVLFGSTVVHNDALDIHETAIYGAASIVIDIDAPGGDRVLPPLRGAADGPDGGPLLTLDEDELSMFFISNGIQPGQVVTVGDTLAIAGQVVPTLPANVEAEIIMPSGRVLRVGGQANAVGYYYDPSQNFTLQESGIWRVRLRVIHEEWTSAGNANEPYPEGSVIGAVESTFPIYVMPEDYPLVELESHQIAESAVAIALPFNITASVPSSWQNVQMLYTITMNGTILDSGEQPAFGDIFAYNYNPLRLNDRFPNLDVTLQNTFTPYSADTVRMTFVLMGEDESGEMLMAARTLLLQGERMITLYDGWPVPEETE